MKDGEILYGFCYERQPLSRAGRRKEVAPTAPLLCLSSELGNSRELEAFAVSLMSQPSGPAKIYCLDLRGRGLSINAQCDNTDISTDADDIISFCDAKGLHHINVLACGHSMAAVLLTAPKRPSLIKKLILNDAMPEFDGVGLARMASNTQRASAPTNWDEAMIAAKASMGEAFTAFGEDDWKDIVRTIWHDNNGKPVPAYQSSLRRLSNSFDYDAPQLVFWRELSILAKRPILLVQGENSLLVTQQFVDLMSEKLSHFERIVANGQGHTPSLHLDGLDDEVLKFLATELDNNSTS